MRLFREKHMTDVQQAALVLAVVGAVTLFCIPASQSEARLFGRRAAARSQAPCVGPSCVRPGYSQSVAPNLTYQGGGLRVNGNGGFTGQLPDSYYRSAAGNTGYAGQSSVAPAVSAAPHIATTTYKPTTISASPTVVLQPSTVHAVPTVAGRLPVESSIVVTRSTTHPTRAMRRASKAVLERAKITRDDALEMRRIAQESLDQANEAINLASMEEMFQAKIDAAKLDAEIRIAEYVQQRELNHMRSQLNALEAKVSAASGVSVIPGPAEE